MRDEPSRSTIHYQRFIPPALNLLFQPPVFIRLAIISCVGGPLKAEETAVLKASQTSNSRVSHPAHKKRARS